MKPILLIEDDPDIRLLIEASLEIQGLSVVSCENGKQGIDEARQGDFQLVLLDLMMPDMSGFDVLKVLKSDPHTAELPVLLLSASTSDEEKAQAAKLGATKFIEKPFDPTELGTDIIQSIGNTPHDDIL